MIYCVNTIKEKNNTALAKAPEDIKCIAVQLGAKEFAFYENRRYKSALLTKMLFAMTGFRNWFRLFCRVRKGDYIIVQHPYVNIRMGNIFLPIIKRKETRCIALVHDLASLRQGIGKEYDSYEKKHVDISDNVFLKKFDYIICHNRAMINYMVNKQLFDNSKLISLEIFDYLYSAKIPETREKKKSIVVAGNLYRGKCAYLYKLIDSGIDIEINLFGPNYSGVNSKKNVVYYGQCSAEELPERLTGSFGLVWDGEDISTCSGGTGEYLRYNNPHKCSLYLASNMPIIIWKEAALAEFVKKNNVGICVESLLDIPGAIDSITDEEYLNMIINVKRIGERLRNGSYFKNAINSVFEKEGYRVIAS